MKRIMRRIRFAVCIVTVLWIAAVLTWAVVYSHGMHRGGEEEEQGDDEDDGDTAMAATTTASSLSPPLPLLPSVLPSPQRDSPTSSSSPPPPPRAIVIGAPSTAQHVHCGITHDSMHVVADDRGQLCTREQLDTHSGCCARNSGGDAVQQCVLRGNGVCCTVYEHCVSSCTLSQSAQETAAAAPSRQTHFVQCTRTCRTSSESLNSRGQYASVYKHCYSGGVAAGGRGARGKTTTPAPSTTNASVEFVEF